MTSGAIRQLQYVSGTMSVQAISRETGIDPVSLSFSLAGAADVPSDGKTALRNLYQQTAYNRLRESGMSSAQANRFRSYGAETVLNIEFTMQEMVFKYSLGTLWSMSRNMPKDATFEDMSDLYADAYNRVLEGFQKSRKSFEDWKDY